MAISSDIKRDVYQWLVLPFGTTCSLCLATFPLQKHVMDHSLPNEDVHIAVEQHFDMDNWLQSLHIVVEAKRLAHKLRKLLRG